MPKAVQPTTSGAPDSGDREAFRHFGDGYAGKLVAARLQGYDSGTLAYIDVAVDGSGQLKAAAGGGGGAVTVADGADVAQGNTSDVAWVSGAGSLIAISKGEFAKLEAIRALLAGSLTVNVGLTDTQLRAAPVPVSGTVTATGPLTDTQLRATAPHVIVDTAPTTAVTIASLPSGAVTNAGTFAVQADTELPAAAALADAAANPTAPATGAFGMIWNGTTWDRAPGSAAAGTKIQSAQLPAALGAGGGIKVDGSGTALPVSGTFFQGTQPVSAVSLPLPAGAAVATGQSAVKAASTLAAAADTAQVVQHSPQRADASTLAVTVTATVGLAATLTLPAPAAGLFHYITSLEIVCFATALKTAGATPVLVTTTNLPGSPIYSFAAAAAAAGTTDIHLLVPTTPLKSAAAATATTVVAPATLLTIWRMNVTYYVAP